MADIKIDAPKALALLQEAVAERGDQFIYAQAPKVITDPEGEEMETRGCWYELNGAPSCGVGAALHKAGVPIQVLDALDQAPGDTQIESVDHVLSDNGVHLTRGALAVFGKFQALQDLETTWGRALMDSAITATGTKESDR